MLGGAAAANSMCRERKALAVVFFLITIMFIILMGRSKKEPFSCSACSG